MFLKSIGKSHILGIYACFFKAMKRRGKIIAVGFMCDARLNIIFLDISFFFFFFLLYVIFQPKHTRTL